MSQSATLYSVTRSDFSKIEQVNGKNINAAAIAQNSATFGGSFMALEFILCKGQEDEAMELIREIFNPEQDIGGTDLSEVNFESLRQDQIEFLLDIVYYLPSKKVNEINLLLSKIDKSQVSKLYNAGELNSNGIYPNIWHNDNDLNLAYNERHILEDYKGLKVFFEEAAKNGNYVLCYVG